uniref:Vomeronasal type-1 receptor n=1 Tax=Pongo abelii TaxID=9601 RepID=A0A8I5YMU0_PONAB
MPLFSKLVLASQPTLFSFFSASSPFLLFLHLRPEPTYLPVCHVALVHTVVLLTTVFLSPQLFESLNFQSDFKYEASFYLRRVMRVLSICTTCLLGVLQVITISPNTSWNWRRSWYLHSPSCYLRIFPEERAISPSCCCALSYQRLKQLLLQQLDYGLH